MKKTLWLALGLALLALPAQAASRVYFNAINDTMTAATLTRTSVAGYTSFSSESSAVLQVDECDYINMMLRVIPVTADTTNAVTIAVSMKALARAPWESGFHDSSDAFQVWNPGLTPHTLAIPDTSVWKAFTTGATSSTEGTVFPGEQLFCINPNLGRARIGTAPHSQDGFMIPLNVGRAFPGPFRTRFVQVKIRYLTGPAGVRFIAHVECVDTSN